VSVHAPLQCWNIGGDPCYKYLKSVTSDAPWGKDSLREVSTARARCERGKADDLSALGTQSRNKAIPRSRVQASKFPRSEPLDQEVKTKLILGLVTGSEAHRWANIIEIK